MGALERGAWVGAGEVEGGLFRDREEEDGGLEGAWGGGRGEEGKMVILHRFQKLQFREC